MGGVYNAPTCSRLSRNCAAACAGSAPKSGRDAVLDLASSVGGIALAISAEEACRRFELPADRIGDVVVLSDRYKVIGTAATRHDLSGLTEPLRSHGGLTEQTVPMIVNRPVRMAELIVQRFGVRFNSNYLVEWLQARGHPPPSDPPP